MGSFTRRDRPTGRVNSVTEQVAGFNTDTIVARFMVEARDFLFPKICTSALGPNLLAPQWAKCGLFPTNTVESEAFLLPFKTEWDYVAISPYDIQSGEK